MRCYHKKIIWLSIAMAAKQKLKTTDIKYARI